MATAPNALDPREFRNALGAFPTGVAVVTTRAASGVPVGLTVNSFSSLSLDPPLVLWSLNVNSPSLEAFDRGSHFAVNILAADQLDIAKRFAVSAPDKFAQLGVHNGIAGMPLLADCAAHIECRRHARHSGGDHILYIGYVERVSYDQAKRPLVFCGGRYIVSGDILA